MKNASSFNPMNSREAINLSEGRHVSTKGHGKPKMGAGKQMGPGIHPRYIMDGNTSNTGRTGGKFGGVKSVKQRKSKVIG